MTDSRFVSQLDDLVIHDVQKDMPDVGDVHVPNAGGKTKQAKKRRLRAILYDQLTQGNNMAKAQLFDELWKAAKAAESGDGDIDDEEGDDGDEESGDPPTMKKSAYAYTPKDGEPKLDISDARHVAMAAEALSSSGFRGNKVQIPEADLPAVKAKVRAAWKHHNPDKDDSEMPVSIRKDDSDVELGLSFSIIKMNEEQKVIYGFASVTKVGGVEVTDLQNDVIDIAEVTKAAHDFIANSRVGGYMHNRFGTGVIVESLILDPVMKQALGITRPEEGWLIGYKADDQTWDDAKAGKFTGFSIGGTGVRTPVE